MAKRLISTSFWSDTYIEDLEVDEKLLFIYLITNPLCNIGGAYEIKLKRISYETGIPKERIEKILKKFDEDDRIVLIEDWIFILNFAKHQSDNPNIRKGIERVYEELPEKIKASKAFQRVSKRLGYLIKTLLQLNKNFITTQSQPNAPAESVSEEDVFKIFRKFKKLSPKLTGTETKQIEATKKLIGEYGQEKALLIVDQAIAIQGTQYSPKILTPLDLWEKIGDLQVYLKRKQEDKQNSTVAQI